MKKQKSQASLIRELTLYGALAALSAAAQLLHIGYQTQWGMWIDVVGVSWIMAYMLFGLRGGLIVSTVGAIIISLVAPETWLGATAKYIATVPVILVLDLFVRFFHIKRQDYRDVKKLIGPVIAAVFIRGIIMFFFNYSFALHIWIPGKTSAELMMVIPPFIVIGINGIQTLLDVFLAWALLYPGKLSERIKM